MTAGKYFHPGTWNLMAFWYIVGKNMMEMICEQISTQDCIYLHSKFHCHPYSVQSYKTRYIMWPAVNILIHVNETQLDCMVPGLHPG